MHQYQKQKLEELKILLDKLNEYLREDQYQNETGAYCFLDFKEESYEIIKRYYDIEVKVFYKDGGYENIYYFKSYKYNGYEYEHINYDCFKNNIYRPFGDFDMLLIHIDKYFEQKELDKLLSIKQIDKKYTTNVHKI